MPLDAICMQAVVRETAAQIENARIEKIQQPARDQVILLLRGGRRLLLNAGASQPRLHLTQQLRDNPAQPPRFCMLLRKHLAGGRLLRLEQEPLERVVALTIRAVDELGEQSDYRLILEAMPRHANLILVDREGRIVDCLRRVDFEMSQQRQVLPGLYYHLPPRQDKCDPLTTEEDTFRRLLARRPEDSPLDRWLMDTFTAIPPLLARELVCRTCGETDARSAAPDTLWQTFHTWQQQVQEGRFLPQLLEREGRPADFSYFPVTQYGPSVTCRTYDTFARLLAGAAGEEPDPVRRRVLAQLLYHLGRWIYLTDAADDLAKDQRSGSYNPLPLRFSMQEGKLTEESRQELAQTMDRSVERMAAAFELLECGVWQPIIESVVYAGLYQVGNAVLNGTFHQRPRREKYPERKAGHGDA